MFKQVLVVTAILLFVKPPFVKATTSSADAVATSSCNGIAKQTTVCGKDEVSNDCIEGGCQPITCSDLDRNIPCKKIDPKYCTTGCLCKDGYLRANNGTCVPISSCTLSCKKRNEVFVKCPQICPPQTCLSLNHTYFCPRILIVTNSTNCRPACRCKTGYYRNLIKECISKEDCLKCTGPNEYYSKHGSGYDNVCARLNKEKETNSPIEKKACNKSCYCEKGYARAKNNTCIPINSCAADTDVPATTDSPITTTESSSSSCGGDPNAQPGCGSNCGKQCSNVGGRVTACPLFCEVDGCDCKDGYYFNSDTNNCVLPEYCPRTDATTTEDPPTTTKNSSDGCGGDPNAEPGCGSNCGKLCSDVGATVKRACPLFCKADGCNCKNGYYFNSNTKSCVLPKNCGSSGS